jgi:hypothetical protein
MSDLYLEPIVGYRTWQIKGDRIVSRIIDDVAWPVNEKLEATCRDDNQFCHRDELTPEVHDAPAWGCTCGIYAFHTLSDAVEDWGKHEGALVGSCVFWGKIVVHTIGFKAQYARPIAFTNHHRANRDLAWTDRLEMVVAAYNIPLVPFDVLEDYTLTFGQRIIDEIKE